MTDVDPRLLRRIALGVAIAAAWSTSAAAQDYTADPSYGTITLSSGFSPDPNTTSLQSGGTIDAAKVGSGCSGNIANAPDVRVVYSAGSLPLIISATADVDTTLVVNAPDGRWYCDDDSGDGVDPMITFDSPQSGRYEVWVGTFWDDEYHPATLNISELYGSTSTTSDSGSPDSSLAPSFGSVSLTSGFTPDPYTVNLRSGGSISASSVGSNCSGYVAAAPDFRVDYQGGSLPLLISVDADSDTTLIVNDPNGNWFCDDDSGEDLNPSLRFAKPVSGQYDIWVGTYADGTFQDAELNISELYSE